MGTKTFIDYKSEEAGLLVNSAKRNLEQNIDLFDDVTFEKMNEFFKEWWGWAKGDGYHAIACGFKLKTVATASRETVKGIIEQLKNA